MAKSTAHVTKQRIKSKSYRRCAGYATQSGICLVNGLRSNDTKSQDYYCYCCIFSWIFHGQFIDQNRYYKNIRFTSTDMGLNMYKLRYYQPLQTESCNSVCKYVCILGNYKQKLVKSCLFRDTDVKELLNG
jgi:hypothetical protein